MTENIIRDNTSPDEHLLFYGDNTLERIINGIISIGLLIFAFASAISISITNISLLALITPLFLIKIFMTRGKCITRTPLDLPIIIYFSVILITAVASYRIEGMRYVLTSLKWFITKGVSFLTFYIVYYNVRDNIKKYLLMLFVLGMTVNCCYALAVFTTNVINGIDPTFARPAGFLFWVTYATLTVFSALIALHFTTEDDQKLKIFGWITFVIISVGVLFSISRSAVLAYFISIISYILLRKKWIYIIIIVIFLTGVFFAPDVVRERLRDTFINKEGGLTLNLHERYDERGVIFKTGWEMIKRYPLLGVGPENMATEYLKFRPLSSDYNYDELHNDILNITAECGFPGLLAFLFLLFVIVRRSILNFREEVKERVVPLSALALSVLIAYCITGFARYNVGDFEVFNALMFILAVSFKRGEGL